jgi:bifunctional non-homologous end joining protein LigD
MDRSIQGVRVETSDGPETYMMANSTAAVFALTQMGVMEIHPWAAKEGKLGFPDRIVMDFDPDDSVSWDRLVQAALALRALFDELGLQSFVKTTGGKGLHVVVPIRPTQPWDHIKGFTRAIAGLMVQSAPTEFTAMVSKSRRQNKILVDYLRNAEGSTAIAAYAARARAGAPVAMPIAWEDLGERDLRFAHLMCRIPPPT